MSSEIRANTLKNRVGLSTINITDTGIVVSGISTFSDKSNFNSNVGIGTNNPDSLLTLGAATNPTLQIKTGTTSRLKIIGDTGAAKVLISSQEGYPLALGAAAGGGASEALRITSGGSVGVGSVVPANILDVQGSTHAKIHIGTTGTGHATGIQINHAKGNAALQEWQLQTDGSADGNLKIRNATSSTDTMFFDADNNNVGINETSPDNKLHVTTNNDSDYSTTTSTQNSTNALLKLENLSGTDNSGVNNYVGIQFAVASGATSRAQLQYVRTGNNAGAFHFKARNEASTYLNLMQISSDGSVNKPKNPAFYAWLSTNNATYTAGTIIPWDNTDIDTRSAFETSGSDQGRFIVPTTGIYYFGWRLNRRNDSRFDIAIYKNGSVEYVDEMRWTGTASMWIAEAGHYLMSCTAGQKIDLRVFGVTATGTAMFDGGGNGYYDAFFGWMVG